MQICSCHEVIPIADSSQVGQARRRAVAIADQLDLDESKRGEVAIVTTELATNLAKHAKQGELLLRPDALLNGLEIISIDRGPGMADLNRCLEDGYSTAGTAGNGLGAVRRLATEFEICSSESGTVAIVRLLANRQRNDTPSVLQWGAVSRAAPYETECGDTWRVARRDHELAVLVADGLGHGPLATAAAVEAAAAFDRDPFAPLTSILQSADARMRGTRGGTVAVAHVNAQQRTLRYAGVGNISGSLRTPIESPGKGLVSHNGTLGVQVRKIQEFEYPCSSSGLLVMHSDGLQSRWSLNEYPGLTSRHPALIAGVLQRDFTRGRDDVTVVAIRWAA